MSDRTIIEVNGVKLEVDLRTARRVDEIRVGDRVKVLVKTAYSDHKVYSGTVIGFEPFQALPTIIVAYLEVDYSGASVKFVYFNAKTEGVEIIKAIDDDVLDIDKSGVLQRMDHEIEKKLAEVEDLRSKRAFFLANFKAYWPEYQKVGE